MEGGTRGMEGSVAGRPYGSGRFGQWIEDGFGLPAYRYRVDPDAADLEAGTYCSRVRRPGDHVHQVGNDRLVAVVSTCGYVRVRQDEGGPKFLDDHDPETGRPAGGFGRLSGGPRVLATGPDRQDPAMERVFGMGYYRRTVEDECHRVDQVVFAPFGDDPLLISQVTIQNKGVADTAVAWEETWGCRLVPLSYRAHLMAMYQGDMGRIPGIRRRMSAAYRMEDVRREASGLLVRPVHGGPDPGLEDEWRRTYALASSHPTLFGGEPIQAPLPTCTFEDPSPPAVFLLSLDAPAEEADLDPSQGRMRLVRRFGLAGGESRTLFLAYGYLPEGFRLEDLLTRYGTKSLPGLLERSCGLWRGESSWLQVPDAPWIGRELKWSGYCLRSGMTFDTFFGEHVLSQGGVYQYLGGIQGAVRDMLQHALPFVLSEPRILREALRYAMKEMLPDGSLPFAITGHGVIWPTTLRSSDLGLWLLWAAAEYVLVTRHREFLDERVAPYPMDGIVREPESVRCLLERCRRHVLEVIGTGPHGLMRITAGDWNDGIILNHTAPEKRPEAERLGESVLNAAMASYVLDAYTDLLAFDGDPDGAASARAWAAGQRDAVRAQWTGRWFRRAWLGPGTGWLGEDELWLEPQGWAILGGCAPKRQAAVLRRHINRLLRQPSPIGAMIRNADEGASREVPSGESLEGGVWMSVNGVLSWALTRVDGLMAWEEWERNLLSRHAEAYPGIWYGIWSGPDHYNSVRSPRAGLAASDRDPERGHNSTDFPVMNLHAHAWPIYGASKMLGLASTAEGIRLEPAIPHARYRFHSTLVGFRKDEKGYSGWYAPLAKGCWTIRLRMPKEERKRYGTLLVNGYPQPLSPGREIVIRGTGGPGSPLRWKLH